MFASAGGAQIAGYFYNADGTRRYSNEQTQQHAYYDGDQEIYNTDGAGGSNFDLNDVIRRYIRLPGPRAKPRFL